MKRASMLSLLCLGFAQMVCAAAVDAQVSVDFTKPEQFSDIGFTHAERERALNAIKYHFERHASQLPAGSRLKIQVADVDLAGEIEPNFAGRSLRVMRGITLPRLEFSYALVVEGKSEERGEARITDLNYLSQHSLRDSNEPFRYEKELIDRWFADQFPPRSK
ncbi:DUF3016 domain-containing protein [Roseateles sp. BYS180W]|uniref:DUF3016 domain-containing protein n=1 Tax=Roseateles rivi TaxID=3299028 RepID=A0ABW7FUR6_9BURK